MRLIHIQLDLIQCDCRELCAATRRQAAAFYHLVQAMSADAVASTSWQPAIFLLYLMTVLLESNDGGITPAVQPRVFFFNLCIGFGRRALLVLRVRKCMYSFE